MSEIFRLQQSFKYKDVFDVFDIIFNKEHIIIKGNTIHDIIYFSDITKVTFSTNKLKLFLKNGNKVKLFINRKERASIEKLFIKHDIGNISEKSIGSAMIIFGDQIFYINLYNTKLNDMKLSFVKRISLHFYPALNHEGINIDDYKNFEFYVKDGNVLTPIIYDMDFKAMCNYYANKLTIMVKNKQ
ncbi:myosin heavy chain [Enterocytozoon bieneusi H348]|nr:myosin heavy chain [Enterocytozoon bieneusi H348]|eukprot:XP_002650040.1 myosin heavy chain [Enterocytozoon bieneusi H348]